MERIKKYIPKIVLLDAILYVLIMLILSVLLSCFNLMFRQWVYIVSAVLIVAGLVVGIIQLLLKIKSKGLKISLIVLFIVSIVMVSPYLCVVVAFNYTPEHVVIKDGKMYVAYVDGFLDTWVDYYDYKSPVICGNKVRIIDDSGDEDFDSFEDNYDDYEEDYITILP